MSFISCSSKRVRLIVLVQNSSIIFMWLEQLSRPSGQTTWLKVKSQTDKNWVGSENPPHIN
eukprot:831539-Pelagomonas_calceolata.AAC.1